MALTRYGEIYVFFQLLPSSVGSSMFYPQRFKHVRVNDILAGTRWFPVIFLSTFTVSCREERCVWADNTKKIQSLILCCSDL